MRLRIGRSAGAATIALAAWGLCGAADLDRGVIRLAEPSTAAEAEAAPAAADPLPDARRGFDADAFDARLEGLWFQRKALEREGRAADVERQAGLIRDFVAEEGVSRLEAPAGALLLEAAAWLREGNSPKALASLALAEALDPDRPQIPMMRARVYWSGTGGMIAAARELVAAGRLTLAAALADKALLNQSALAALAALGAAIVVTALFLVLRYQVVLRHDVEEAFVGSGHDVAAKAAGWGVLLLPFVVWIGAGWAALYGLVLTFRYAKRTEKLLVVALLAAAALIVPAFRLAVGLYGLDADPTLRTTIDAAGGAFDPDRVVKLRELVEAHPDDPTYRFLLAAQYKKGRYFEEAFSEYRRVLETAPSTYQARINLGNIYFLLGQYGEAISHYRRALDAQPDSVLAYYDMYLAQSDSFKLKEAADSLARARDLDPAEINRLLSEGTSEGGGPKVIDATIDTQALWNEREGRGVVWQGLAGGLLNALSLAAGLALAACGVVAVTFRSRPRAVRCQRCGRPFCAACKSGRDSHDFCSQCVHLFVLRDGLAPETKSMKLYEIERHETRSRRLRWAASTVIPGAAHLLAGRPWIGASLVFGWMLAWFVGAPAVLAPVVRAAGMDLALGALQAGPVPALSGLSAAAIVAAPLGVTVWLAAHATVRRLRGA
ncbi:MAG TPA: tetratricopeptide repeat protein [Candidatus Polarisedimenticolaceae bacterium]|nr:tetratricopeptide repeat protein [Candidatus Polarisedimenticolaceae bacterium]